MKIISIFKTFFNSEKAPGLILIAATCISLCLANSAFGSSYHNIWQISLAGHSIEHWINDGLMAIFFLLIGLELEREIYQGALSKIKDATFPIFAAIGGMVIPAVIYLLINKGTTYQSGAGIPMATDIAFALGILSLLGKRVPTSLKVFLTALAVIDDLGAILIIAIFYTKTLALGNLAIALGIFGALLIMNRIKIHNLIPYILGGIAMWYFMLHSGVHASITGILLAFAIPFGSGKTGSPSYILEHLLHKPVTYLILPVFALANTAIALNFDASQVIKENYSLGITLGLVAGKPLGIFLFTFMASAIGFCKPPSDLSWKHIFGAGCLGGIGFTMSIFISLLAFNNESVINNAKFMILVASMIAAIIGFVSLKFSLKQK